MACINFSTLFPDRVDRVILIGTGLRATPLHRIHNFEQIRAIESDSGYRGGRYEPPGPYDGLVLARMISHKSFVSLRAMAERSRRQVVAHDVGEAWYGVSHPLESYMMHQGRKVRGSLRRQLVSAHPGRLEPLRSAGGCGRRRLQRAVCALHPSEVPDLLDQHRRLLLPGGAARDCGGAQVRRCRSHPHHGALGQGTRFVPARAPSLCPTHPLSAGRWTEVAATVPRAAIGGNRLAVSGVRSVGSG